METAKDFFIERGVLIKRGKELVLNISKDMNGKLKIDLIKAAESYADYKLSQQEVITKEKIEANLEEYFYSEGYVYKGEETICRLYGTEKQMLDTGNTIAKQLNNHEKRNKHI